MFPQDFGAGREVPLSQTLKSTIYLGWPVWFVNWTENLSLAVATSSNHRFLKFGQFLNFLRKYFFSYALLFMVSREEAMDQYLEFSLVSLY